VRVPPGFGHGDVVVHEADLESFAAAPADQFHGSKQGVLIHGGQGH
jgi:hypothetical protein